MNVPIDSGIKLRIANVNQLTEIERI